MDSIEVFMSKIEHEIDGMAPGTLKPDIPYREIDSWSSMHSLIIIALMETEYDVAVNGEDLRKCNTVRELYDLVKSRK
ncbi:MAG: hypothetical protein K1X56_01085 [Flavobacteriales bacterium]|nr:hypothetical protein [Flavobacteriales bacterium]